MNENEQSMTCRKAIQPTSKLGRVVGPGQTQIVPVYRLSGVRRRGCMSLIQAFKWNVGTCWSNVKEREITENSNFASTNVDQRGGVVCSSNEIVVMTTERRNYIIQSRSVANQYGRSSG